MTGTEGSGTTATPLAPAIAAPEGFAGRDVWIFDLDDTLYPPSSGLGDAMRGRAVEFIQRLTGTGLKEAAALQRRYYETYGATLIGLRRRHGVAPIDFLAFIHDIEISPVGDGARVGAALARLPGRRLVFTNGPLAHAERVLGHLGIRRLFDGVAAIEASGYVGKPAPSAYAAMIKAHVVAPERAVMFEDRAENLKAAHALGMSTVLLTEKTLSGAVPYVDVQTADLAEFLNWLVDDHGTRGSAGPDDHPNASGPAPARAIMRRELMRS